MHHELKTWPAYYQAVFDGRKTFEIRDGRERGFQAGDTVTLREFIPPSQMFPDGNFTGAELTFRIGYVTSWEQRPGFVVFSLLSPPGDQEQ
jgi:hypothetical protein